MALSSGDERERVVVQEQADRPTDERDDDGHRPDRGDGQAALRLLRARTGSRGRRRTHWRNRSATPTGSRDGGAAGASGGRPHGRGEHGQVDRAEAAGVGFVQEFFEPATRPVFFFSSTRCVHAACGSPGAARQVALTQHQEHRQPADLAPPAAPRFEQPQERDELAQIVVDLLRRGGRIDDQDERVSFEDGVGELPGLGVFQRPLVRQDFRFGHAAIAINPAPPPIAVPGQASPPLNGSNLTG